MSNFSEAFAAYLDRTKITNLTFSAATGLNDSDISRWRRGIGSRPSDKALLKMLPHLPDDDRLHLCICWLRDETPEEMRPRIAIQPTKLSSTADPTRTDWQQALDFFARGCEHTPLMRTTIVGLHRLMTKNAASENPFKITRVIGDQFARQESIDTSLNEAPPPAIDLSAAKQRVLGAASKLKP